MFETKRTAAGRGDGRFGRGAARRMMLMLAFGASLAAAAGSAVAGDHDWTRFRGPNGSGVAAETSPLPMAFGPDENLAWKVALPGLGSSSPILVGDRIFLTSWSGYGVDSENPGEPEDLRRNLICLDRETGALVWSRSVPAVLPEDPYGGMFAQNGYASHTPVSDGERVYAHFGKTGVVAFDLDGELLWHTLVGDELDPHRWGSASSPIVHGDLVIVTATAESEALVGLDKRTGEEAWRQEAAGFNGVWGTPVLVDAGEGRRDLVMAVPNEIWGFDPATGDLRWFANGIRTRTFCPSAVTADGVVFAMVAGPTGGGGIAIRAGGEGDVTDTHTVWAGRQSCGIGTPVLYEDRIYALSNGMLDCYDRGTGKRVYRERLETPAFEAPGEGGGEGEGEGGGGRSRMNFNAMDYASPIVADDKIYHVTRKGFVHVIRPGDEFESLAVNRVTTDDEDFSASPAVGDGRLFIRSDKHLYCFAIEDTSTTVAASDGPDRGEGYRPPGGGGGGGGMQRDPRAGRPDRPARPSMDADAPADAKSGDEPGEGAGSGSESSGG